MSKSALHVCPDIAKFSVHAICGRGSDGSLLSTSGFVDDVISPTTGHIARACATSTRVPRSSKYSSDERRHVPRSTLPSYTMAANCAPGAKSARVYSALFVLNDVPNSENVHFLLPARRPGTHYPLTFEKSQILILFI